MIEDMPFSFIFCHERLCKLCVEKDVGLVVCVEEEVVLVVHCGGCWVGCVCGGESCVVWWRMFMKPRGACYYEAPRGMLL